MNISFVFKTVQNFNIIHPECALSKVFLRNVECDNNPGGRFIARGNIWYLTATLGINAYNEDGNRIYNKVPVFVEAWEYYLRKFFPWIIIATMIVYCNPNIGNPRQVNTETYIKNIIQSSSSSDFSKI
jgi:hypothetical protein